MFIAVVAVSIWFGWFAAYIDIRSLPLIEGYDTMAIVKLVIAEKPTF